ncbi:MAG TPA: LysM peptidoglycan-binding domain-containing protein [Nitrospirae bacterium]|nr:LysM peptidoglycan-binding domain-containing protein [Nitrospirota bacterium]
MKTRLFVCALFLILLTSGCSLTQYLAVGNQGGPLPEVPAVKSVDEDDNGKVAIDAFVQQEINDEVIDDGCEVYGECENEYTEKFKDEKSEISQIDETPGTVLAEKPEEPAIPAVPAVPEKTEREKKQEEKEKAQNLLDTALEFCNASQEYWSEGDLVNAFATLDEAYALVLKVKTGDDPDLIQQKEDLRFTISKRILEIYASRYTAVNGNHDEIPLIMNEHVEKEIKRFQGREKRFLTESYKRSGRYMDKIVVALEKAGLPEELAWLPLIESGFKVKALSRARALGLWQFIPSTGYKFGLKRDPWIDERLDPEKATAAAIAYLKELHKIFGDWTTVLAAYNCGEGRVLKKIRNQKINYLDNFWDLYEQLPRETARYVPKFMAVLHILKDPAKYGITLEEPDSPLVYETVTIEKPVQLWAVANKIGVSLKELTALNPELRRKATPATSYSLKVPAGKGEVLLAGLDEIAKWSPPKNAYVYHRVRKGETLSVIALRYRTSVSKIVRANNIRRKHFIRAGKKLKIPLRGSSIGRIYASSKVVSLPPGGKYRVKKGDSLWLIARRFKTNTKKLQQINELETTRLRVGQVLRVAE